ncbi:S41 family peptidase [Tengunoibacter tsumagoiensis]|uniref:Tricorn protease homolog n=1 Tax=Tengunoibacter tsumagoiensis TaxID=2014871 RepID=A0A402A3B3_9CHLR|nr:S41 family peptidase [Tengunoibacter tsumagoiensis]GCE13640.1 tricorn protease [Tengunoibacter tsumagoiensis]
MASQGYVRFPTLSQDRIVFVSEDDLWLVSSQGGRAERLTAGVGEVSSPRFSPDGSQVAFVSSEEGPREVYCMPSQGGPARRLTFQAGGHCQVLGWSLNGEEILYASNAGQFFSRLEVIYAINAQGGLPQQLPFGMANAISYSQQGKVVIGRNTSDISYWKRYRGGTAGHLWCDTQGNGEFKRLLQLSGNIADPCWIDERIYFISDHDGIGNLYSCTAEGEDLRQHSSQTEFYARHLSTDGKRLVYASGADLYLYDPQSADPPRQLPLQLPSLRTQRSRKFVHAASYLDTYALHPQGYALALTTRGKAFTMGNWEGPVLQHGEADGVRYRFLEWLNDGKRLLAVHDAPGQEELIVFHPQTAEGAKTYPELAFGRAVSLVISPLEDKVAITNHRNELLVVDLEKRTLTIIDRSRASLIDGVAWSPDGRWLAYGFAISPQKTAIKLAHLDSGQTHQITNPVLQDTSPSFDPEGKYLYFLGKRVYNPVRDHLHFDMSFPRGEKPYLILLQDDLRSPFIPEMKVPGDKEERRSGSKAEATENAQTDAETPPEENDPRGPAMRIDLEGITERILPFPVPEGRYYGILGIKGKVLFLGFPVSGLLPEYSSNTRGYLDLYDFENYKVEHILENVSTIELSRDTKTLLYRAHSRLRVLKAGEKPPRSDHGDRPGRESGWIDLQRVKVAVHPALEWKQMFAEAWRLQREHFWDEDMLGIDWDGIYAQYAPLVERVSSRSELSDLLGELQGELGTSHAYENGGDLRRGPYYYQGSLGVDWSYDAEHNRYRIARIIKGDPSDRRATSPFTMPGLHVKVGDAVLAINGQRLVAGRTPQELLVNQAGQEVQLTIEDGQTGEKRVIVVEALRNDMTARYREWVESNRRRVHEISGHQVGYIHIPDMGSRGYAEFHRGFLSEYDYPALLIDVRWNGGGNVSSLLLEKLARKRIGYDFPRWYDPKPYPVQSPRGPMVALTNEHAGSDGDIFCHSFKLMGLGPLIGMRTWGGVIGYTYRHQLVDGTVTTQPEYSSWFKDVGWNIENYGTDPDIEVDIAPQDYAHLADPQLDRAIAEALHQIEILPALEPNPGERPYLGRKRTIADKE